MEGPEFEQEVLRIARAMWPTRAGEGPINLGGRERDAIFISEERVTLIECTVSRTKVKAQEDGKKLNGLVEQFNKSHSHLGVKGYFITLEEPTADQRGAIKALKNRQVVALSFAEFRSWLIDASTYLEARADHPFGSARSLDDGDGYAPPGEYSTLDILEEDREGKSWSVREIQAAALEGKKIVLLGDFGAGKSMTLREVFLGLAAEFRSRRTTMFPIHLNLREHSGQSDPSEVLIRHANSVGFKDPHQLVRAWKSGYAVLLLDGFDELATTNWSGEVARVKEARRRAVRLIQAFINDSPSGCGVLLAGREHYFDTPEERQEALGYTGSAAQLTLNDFSNEQIARFLEDRVVPEWLPGRPYLLGYLAARDLLPEGADDCTPADGWDRLIDAICAREANQVDESIQGTLIRRVLERLASAARTKDGGLGPLTFDDVSGAYREVVGYSPEEGALVLLQRLPGLGIADPVDGTRKFIDETLVDVLYAGDPFEFSQSPYANALEEQPRGWMKVMGPTGTQVLANKLSDAQLPGPTQMVAAKAAAERQFFVLAVDVLRAIELQGNPAGEERVVVDGVWIDEFKLGYSGIDWDQIHFRDCVVDHLDVNPPLALEQTPNFEGCSFAFVDGVSGPGDLVLERFVECEFERFSDALSTNSGILGLNISLGERVGLTVLRKLYLQKGTGRKDGALSRGLDDTAQSKVDDVLQVLQNQGLITKSKAKGQVLWLPVRGEGARVRQILESPTLSDDPVMLSLRAS